MTLQSGSCRSTDFSDLFSGGKIGDEDQHARRHYVLSFESVFPHRFFEDDRVQRGREILQVAISIHEKSKIQNKYGPRAKSG